MYLETFIESRLKSQSHWQSFNIRYGIVTLQFRKVYLRIYIVHNTYTSSSVKSLKLLIKIFLKYL